METTARQATAPTRDRGEDDDEHTCATHHGDDDILPIDSHGRRRASLPFAGSTVRSRTCRGRARRRTERSRPRLRAGFSTRTAARPGDEVIVQEKLDGSCVALVRDACGRLEARGSEGRLASESGNDGRRMFAAWLAEHEARLEGLLAGR